MNRPSVTKYKTPVHISEYPVGPCYQAGHLVTENAGWRVEKPILVEENCTGCLYCYLCCPEGVISKVDGQTGLRAVWRYLANYLDSLAAAE